MTDTGWFAYAPDGPEAPVPPKRRVPVAAIVAVLVVLALIAGGLVAFLVLKDDGDEPSYPKTWDSRIAPYVKIVEKERRLTFKHPVEVRFLDAAAFEKTVKSEDKDLDKKERREIDEVTSLFRAFGLIDGDVDLFEAFNDAYGSGTLAYYSFDDQRITVKGKELSLAVRATLVHELTHALQDQRFDIGNRMDRLSKETESGKPTTAYDALEAIVEGDAERTADLYRKTLSAADQKALAKAEEEDQGDAQKGLEKVPGVVVSLISAPYALGQALTEAVAEEDKDDVDDLFRDPPTNDSVLVDPMAAATGDTDIADVAVPGLEDGEKKFDSGQIGALTTYLMLAQRIPVLDALAATDGWDGDAFVAFTRDDVKCARVSYATKDDAATGRLLAALRTWIAAVPGSKAEATRDGDRIVFESCDPGTSAELGKDHSTTAVELVATRAYLGVGVLQAGANADTAKCFAHQMIEQFPVAELQNPNLGKDDPAVVRKIQKIATDCR
ncbi:hypothetical protein EFK50_19890 [Nocardioides marmoriginsengisoli]|uniref:Uncharacterized protein n=1 Tax=Nocardioides marmoriginsengisoli TaxID=661483 RepID=A0A3N0CAV9_9ACTN|nr:hypothetical protein [Nocardioides marmoriginsengisoli]RNL60580.1 hypothetical protein EFK50_19890 [Nocardioides marmoriginsengisoli]